MVMKIVRDSKLRKKIRAYRARRSIIRNSNRPRLLFNKTLRYLYVQLIDDKKKETLFTLSTLNNKDLKNVGNGYNLKNKEVASIFGKYVGEKLLELGINSIVFDRNGYLYHGKVQVFADAIREKGIDF